MPRQPQVGILRILRPFTGFETLYQGEPVTTWIMFSEDGVALDDNAGQTGYAPGLLRGLSVPLGAVVKLWIPHIYAATATSQVYTWCIAWRMRNVQEYNTDPKRQGYHVVQQTGVPLAGTPRILKPASYQGYCLPQTETAPPPTAGPAAREIIHVRPAAFQPYSGHPLALPFVPAGTRGVIQQGILDVPPATAITAGMPLYDTLTLRAEGDELLLGVTRDVTDAANWTFTGGTADKLFSDVFVASPFIGAYVMVGDDISGQPSVP